MLLGPKRSPPAQEKLKPPEQASHHSVSKGDSPLLTSPKRYRKSFPLQLQHKLASSGSSRDAALPTVRPGIVQNSGTCPGSCATLPRSLNRQKYIVTNRITEKKKQPCTLGSKAGSLPAATASCLWRIPRFP